jgi:hypothetical protein
MRIPLTVDKFIFSCDTFYVATRIDIIMGMNETGEILTSLQLASSWLLKASSVFTKGGISECYTISEYWKEPSVGVAGAAVKSLFKLASFFDSPSFADKAVVLARWMLPFQLDCGGVSEGRIDEPLVPCVMQTGWAVSGWIAAYQYTNDESFLCAAIYAGEWICAMQHGSGAWRSDLGNDHGGIITAFTSQLAWPLSVLWQLSGMERFKISARKTLDWLLVNRLRNGWFMYNSLDESADATLNHIACCLEGLVYAGIIFGDEKYIMIADENAKTVMQWQRANGEIPQRFNHSFRPVTPKNTAQSIAQMVCIWFELARLTGNSVYCSAAQKANAYLRSMQITDTSADVIRGSLPFERNARKYPVEATVRFIDAQLMELLNARQKADGQ